MCVNDVVCVFWDIVLPCFIPVESVTLLIVTEALNEVMFSC